MGVVIYSCTLTMSQTFKSSCSKSLKAFGKTNFDIYRLLLPSGDLTIISSLAFLSMSNPISKDIESIPSLMASPLLARLISTAEDIPPLVEHHDFEYPPNSSVH